MTDKRLLSITRHSYLKSDVHWWISRVEELIRTIEQLRDEVHAGNTVGRRIVDDQSAGIRAEIDARLCGPRPTLWARIRGFQSPR